MTDSERITQLATKLEAMEKNVGEKLDMLTASVEELRKPRSTNWTAVGVCLVIVSMVGTGIGYYINTQVNRVDTRLDSLTYNCDLRLNSLTKDLADYKTYNYDKNLWNWDGMKQRVDTVKKDQERQEALIRLMIGDRLESYERRITK